MPDIPYVYYVAIIGNYLYLFEVSHGQIYRASVSNPLTWTIVSNSGLPFGTNYTPAFAVIGNYAYLFGGDVGNHIYRAPTSDPTTWTYIKAFPYRVGNAEVLVIGDYIYLVAGWNGGYSGGSLNTIFRAPVSDPTSWSTSSYTLPSVLSFSQATVIGGYAYLFGGYRGFSGRTNAIYRAPHHSTPTCTLTTDWDPINKHVGTILRWSTTNATSLSINQGIGSVSPVASGSVNVYPQTTTTYTGTVSGAGGSATCGRTVTVTPDPTGTLTLDDEALAAGESTTLRWSTTNAHSVFIMSDEGEGEFPTFGGSGAVSASGASSVSPSVSTTYTLYVYDRAGDPDPLIVEATLDVLASCTLDGATVPHGESRTFYSATTAPQGEACSSLAEERTCTDGVLSGSSSYQYASCACAVSYTCDGSTIRQTDASCAVSDLETCVSPQFCSEGSSVCHYAPLGFISGNGRSGHLEAVPSLVRSGDTTKLYWNIENAASCSVTGNGQSWNTAASGVSGKTTAPITKVTTYTLQCTGLSGSSLTEYATVRVVPGWRER